MWGLWLWMCSRIKEEPCVEIEYCDTIVKRRWHESCGGHKFGPDTPWKIQTILPISNMPESTDFLLTMVVSEKKKFWKCLKMTNAFTWQIMHTCIIYYSWKSDLRLNFSLMLNHGCDIGGFFQKHSHPNVLVKNSIFTISNNCTVIFIKKM